MLYFVFSSLVILLVFRRRNDVINDQRQHRNDHEYQNTDDRGEIILGFCAVQRHLIQPGDQKIGVVDRNAACCTDLGIDRGVILRQQINDVEVIHIADYAAGCCLR